jgi:hypothetical protein
MKSKCLSIVSIFMLMSFSFLAQETSNVPPTTDSNRTGCVSGDCENGWGEKIFDDGYYHGFWEQGKRNGYGVFDWNESGKYIGFWVDDAMTGYGVYLGKNKDMVGEYQDGFIHGLGYIVEGAKWEQGRYDSSILVDPYSFNNNGVTVGCVAGDCQNKYGRYNWSNGDTYTGFFKEGKMYLGAFKFENGDRYTGQFNDQNEYHGQGRFFFNNGNYYGGEWKNGKYNGRGYYQGQNVSEDRIGIWEGGVFVESL